MRRCSTALAFVAAAALTASALGQSDDAQDRGTSRQRSSTSSSSGRSGPAITPTPPADQRVPLPGGRGRDRAPQPRTPPDQSPPGDGAGDRPPRERDPGVGDDDRRDRYRPRYPRRPYYYDYWIYDRGRYYDDGYRGYEPTDRGNVRPVDEAADRPAGLGALPPDDLMGDDDELPAEVRKALEASPEYREATAELLRAWADYARTAEQVLLRLRQDARYQRALADLREAEAKVAAVRDRSRGVPAVNLVTVAQEALLARRAVRSLEEKAIDADRDASRARERVDEAVERRNKVREEFKERFADR